MNGSGKNGSVGDVSAEDRISFDDLVSAIEAKLTAAGASPAVANVLATNCATCERDGTLSHGVFRVTGYLDSLTRGWADGAAEASIDVVGPSYIRIDGRNGFAQPALAEARPKIDQALSDTGVAVIALRNTHHFSALWPDLEAFARDGRVAMGMIASGKLAVVPDGAEAPVFGTNPFGFATPLADTDPVVFDFSTSSMSHGDLQLYKLEGKSVLDGTGVDSAGRATNDPSEIISGGGIRPFGGHKGALLSFMIETLAAGLTGGPFSYEIDRQVPEDAHTFRTGQVYIVIDPKRGANNTYLDRVQAFVQLLRNTGMDRMPADRRYVNRAAAAVHGIPVTDSIRELFT